MFQSCTATAYLNHYLCIYNESSHHIAHWHSDKNFPNSMSYSSGCDNCTTCTLTESGSKREFLAVYIQNKDDLHDISIHHANPFSEVTKGKKTVSFQCILPVQCHESIHFLQIRISHTCISLQIHSPVQAVKTHPSRLKARIRNLFVFEPISCSPSK